MFVKVQMLQGSYKTEENFNFEYFILIHKADDIVKMNAEWIVVKLLRHQYIFHCLLMFMDSMVLVTNNFNFDKDVCFSCT